MLWEFYLADIVNVLNLPVYVVGGNVAAAWDAFAPRMFEELAQRSLIYAATAPGDPSGASLSASVGIKQWTTVGNVRCLEVMPACLVVLAFLRSGTEFFLLKSSSADIRRFFSRGFQPLQFLQRQHAKFSGGNVQVSGP